MFSIIIYLQILWIIHIANMSWAFYRMSGVLYKTPKFFTYAYNMNIFNRIRVNVYYLPEQEIFPAVACTRYVPVSVFWDVLLSDENSWSIVLFSKHFVWILDTHFLVTCCFNYLLRTSYKTLLIFYWPWFWKKNKDYNIKFGW